MNACEILIGTIYSRLGLELQESNMLDKHTWAPVKRKDYDPIEAELIKLWETIVGICWGQSIYDMRQWAAASNEIIEKMPDRDRRANQLLLCVHLFDEWLQEGCADFVTKAMWRQRIGRLKLDIIQEVEKASGMEIASHSYIAADNIRRALVGRAMLDSETRKAAVERLKRKLKNRETK